jgi:hypothetical protein
MKRRFMYFVESNAQRPASESLASRRSFQAMCNAIFAAAGQDLVAWTIHRGHGRAGMRRSGVSATIAESLPGRTGDGLPSPAPRWAIYARNIPSSMSAIESNC